MTMPPLRPFQKLSKGSERDPYGTIRAWFSAGHTIDLLNDCSDKHYKKELDKVAGLRKLVSKFDEKEQYTYMEFVLHGLSEFNIINKDILESKFSFRDLLANLFDEDSFDEDYDE